MSEDDQDGGLLSREDIKREFGYSWSTIYRLQKRGKLQALKREGDRKDYFRRSEVEDLSRLRPKEVRRD